MAGTSSRRSAARPTASCTRTGSSADFTAPDAVLAELDTPDELDGAATAFMGGTLFEGMTCSALTAGVMALGLAFGEIEDSRPRVVRMLAMMALRRDALADDVNAFNRAMNLGHDLAAGSRHSSEAPSAAR